MAFERITPLASILGSTGLSYLLMEEDVPASFSLSSPGRRQAPCPEPPSQPSAKHTTAPAPQTVRTAPPQGGYAAYSTQRTSAASPSAESRQPVAPPPQRQFSAPVQQAPQPASNVTNTPAIEKPKPLLPFEMWPANWQNLFNRMSRGWIVWTYWELGADLSGNSSAERKKWLSKLISDFKLPKGTHAFWPICLPEPGEGGSTVMKPNPDVFWAGLRRLGAKMLVVLGSEAAHAAGLTTTRTATPLTCNMNRGIYTSFIWDFQQFTGDENACRYNSVVTFLRQMSRNCMR